MNRMNRRKGEARGGPSSTAPEPAKTRRATRGQRRQSDADADADDARARPVVGLRLRSSDKPSASEPTRGSITTDPIARKGAKVDSPVSIRGRSEDFEDPEEEDDDDDEEGDGKDNEHTGDDQYTGDTEVDDPAGISDDDVLFMRLNLLKLTETAESILKQYRPFTKNDKFMRKRFEMDMGALAPIRDSCTVQESRRPFLDMQWLNDRPDLYDEQEVTALKTAFALTNLATLFEIIYSAARNDLKSAGSPDAKVLKTLDENFETLLLLGDEDGPWKDSVVNFALNIRTTHLIAALKRAKSKSMARKIAHEIFCSSGVAGSDDIKSHLENGPFRLVAGKDSDEIHRRCVTHLQVIVDEINSGSKNAFSSLETLKRMRPAEDILSAAKSMYQELVPLIRKSRETWYALQDERDDDDQFHDAPSEARSVSDDSSDNGESQPTIRPSDTQAGMSLFTGASSIQALARLKSAPNAEPPSNQQAGSRGGVLPVDNNAAPLLTPARQRKRGLPSSSRTNDDDEDDDEDGSFQTDQRPVNKATGPNKRFRTAEKQARHLDQELSTRQKHQQQQRQFQSSSPPHPPLSTSTTVVGGTYTQRPAPLINDFTAIRARKEAATIALASSAPVARDRESNNATITTIASRHVGPKHRTPWSDHDAHVLIECVKERRGKWSLIEKMDAALFEFPRNQQAYRDKARNLKVDFLIADERLPQEFNSVTLGSKERARVIGFGKNPERFEADVDLETGKVTNTQWKGDEDGL